jgi:hypothetical protein
MVVSRLEVPANVVASWSQSGGPIEVNNPVKEPLSCGDGGAPRGFEPQPTDP